MDSIPFGSDPASMGSERFLKFTRNPSALLEMLFAFEGVPHTPSLFGPLGDTTSIKYFDDILVSPGERKLIKRK